MLSATPASLFKRSGLFHAETESSYCLSVSSRAECHICFTVLNVLVCFTQRRGAAICAMSGGDPHVRSDGFGETGGEEMPGAADASTQTVP